MVTGIIFICSICLTNLILVEGIENETKYFIKNPPNSPDLVYPFEALWGYIKSKIKKETLNINRTKTIYYPGMELHPKRNDRKNRG